MFPILVGDHTDFTALWYKNVGSAICVTLSINVVSPYLGRFLWPLIRWLQRLDDRRCKTRLKKDTKKKSDDQCNTNKKLLSELQALYTGPQIASHYVYAQLFSNFMCCLMYSSGMPILYPIACIFNIVLYWMVKILIFKYYQRTSRFNERLAVESLYYIKYGILYHMLVGAFVYTNPEIVSVDGGTTVGVIGKALKKVGLEQRFDSSHAHVYLVMFGIFIFLYAMQRILIQIVLKYLWKFLTCNFSQNKLDDDELEGKEVNDNFSKDILNEFEVSNLAEFYKKSINELNEYKSLLASSNFDDNVFEHDAQQAFAAVLKARVQHIEAAIDNHLARLTYKSGYADMKKGKDPMAKYAKYSFHTKLLLLLTNQTKLIRIDRKRLRMQGTTQSYDILESLQYKQAKLMIKRLQREDFDQARGGSGFAEDKTPVSGGTAKPRGGQVTVMQQLEQSLATDGVKDALTHAVATEMAKKQKSPENVKTPRKEANKTTRLSQKPLENKLEIDKLGAAVSKNVNQEIVK